MSPNISPDTAFDLEHRNADYDLQNPTVKTKYLQRKKGAPCPKVAHSGSFSFSTHSCKLSWLYFQNLSHLRSSFLSISMPLNSFIGCTFLNIVESRS